jgi:integrase
MTFGQVAEKVLAALEPGWSNKMHRHQWRRSLSVEAASLSNMPVDKVDTAAVLSVLAPLWTTRPETAVRLRLRLERVLDWATAHGHRTGENPARWRGHLKNLLPRQAHMRQHFKAAPFDELPELMQRVRAIDGFAPRALEFTTLTACRTREVLYARWPEVDLDARLWTIPAVRMKSRRQHTVPLSDRAVEILRELPRMGEFIFAGRDRAGHLSHPAMLYVLRRLGAAPRRTACARPSGHGRKSGQASSARSWR